jgi:hypothetical protein
MSCRPTRRNADNSAAWLVGDLTASSDLSYRDQARGTTSTRASSPMTSSTSYAVRTPAIPTAVQAIPGKTQRPAQRNWCTHRKVSAARVRPTRTPLQAAVVPCRTSSVVYPHRPLMAPQHESVMRPGRIIRRPSQRTRRHARRSCYGCGASHRPARDSGRMRAGGPGQRPRVFTPDIPVRSHR